MLPEIRRVAFESKNHFHNSLSWVRKLPHQYMRLRKIASKGLVFVFCVENSAKTIREISCGRLVLLQIPNQDGVQRRGPSGWGAYKCSSLGFEASQHGTSLSRSGTSVTPPANMTPLILAYIYMRF